MKKLLLLFVVAGFMFACSGGGSPRSVAESFMKEVTVGNFTEAAKYCTAETGGLLSMASSMVTEDQKEEMKKENINFKFLKEEIDGDTAKVYLADEDGVESQPIDLVKVDGEWKVTVSK